MEVHTAIKNLRHGVQLTFQAGLSSLIHVHFADISDVMKKGTRDMLRGHSNMHMACYPALQICFPGFRKYTHRTAHKVSVCNVGIVKAARTKLPK